MAPAEAPPPTPPVPNKQDDEEDDGAVGRLGKWLLGKSWRTTSAGGVMFSAALLQGVAAALPPLGVELPAWLKITAAIASAVGAAAGAVGLYHAADARRLPPPSA